MRESVKIVPESERRETARWAASVTLLLGKLLPDDFDLTMIVRNEHRRSFYTSRLSNETRTLVNALSNFDLQQSVRTLEIGTVSVAAQLIDSIEAHLTPKTSFRPDRIAAALPMQECEPDDTIGAI